ncbi:conjugal transfer pilus assembly protein TraU [Sphingomonas xinjiangensis]|uniref:conjugal transfer pilus assembly protein TraU n=1 Tax=Sphingomonas xinjiangensis TaxID=643568 RepID=UPI001FEB28F0|nr:conjugal transfer pilus assembly protein TraU [Sphingomonas xinjiangensis]
MFASATLTSSASAQVPTGNASCNGKFVNPITDVCWSCLFPLSIGALPIWPSARPDTNNPDLPICACGSPVPRIGISAGFWEPVRLADVSTKPWCFVNLGGAKISPGFDIGKGYVEGPAQVGGRSQNTSKWHVHWYVYPLLYWMEILTDFLCFEQASFDIAYMTEVDPLWQDDTLTTLINPEAVLFANPIAQAACAGDCVAATAKLALDETFWCSGCQGPMYPVNGNIPAHVDHVQASRLALSRFAFKIHREGLAWGTMGSKGLCNKYPMPLLRKQQYRVQMVNPIPTVSGTAACQPLGASTLDPRTGRAFPVKGEDMGYLVWRKRNCCVL